jgi:hypothetical protein
LDALLKLAQIDFFRNLGIFGRLSGGKYTFTRLSALEYGVLSGNVVHLLLEKNL